MGPKRDTQERVRESPGETVCPRGFFQLGSKSLLSSLTAIDLAHHNTRKGRCLSQAGERAHKARPNSRLYKLLLHTVVEPADVGASIAKRHGCPQDQGVAQQFGGPIAARHGCPFSSAGAAKASFKGVFLARLLSSRRAAGWVAAGQPLPTAACQGGFVERATTV